MLHHAVPVFVQVKQLSDESRLRYALLVSALASREEGLLVATMRELGLVVENCSVEFEVGNGCSQWACVNACIIIMRGMHAVAFASRHHILFMLHVRGT